MSTPGVRFAQSSIEFRHTQTRLRYMVAPAIDGKREIDIWSAFDGHSPVHVTALEVGSGGGKSTFANALAQYLRAHADGAGLQFSFINPHTDSNNRCVALIPQKPALVSHWQVKALLPSTSELLALFFDGAVMETSRHLSSLSGGQQARVYTCSAIEHLRHAGAWLNYLLLDEAFEGLNAAHANRILHGVVRYWSVNFPSRPLFILLISHLDATAVLNGLHARRIMLSPGEPEEVDEEHIRQEMKITLGLVS